MAESPTLQLPLRRYQLGPIYGPGMPAGIEQGPREDHVTMPLASAAVVSVHCWNLGEADGPYPFPPGTEAPGRIEDWVPRAHQIVGERIAPLFAVARAAGMPIFHLGTRAYADRYPGTRGIADDPELQGPPQPQPAPEQRCVRPHDDQMLRAFGPDFPGPAWHTHGDAFDIARAARPVGDEPVLLNGWQLSGLCRRQDIDTLFYVGFMAEICLQHVPGAIREMAKTFGYRCVVLRDCTTAYEYEDTYQGQWMTRTAIRQVECEFGYSATSSQLSAAIEAAVAASNVAVPGRRS